MKQHRTFLYNLFSSTRSVFDFKGMIRFGKRWINETSFEYMLLHVTHEFRSESIHSIVYVNVKEILARSRRHIWNLSDNNGIQTHNHLFRQRTLRHLAKLAKRLSCVVSTYLYGVFDCMLLWVRILLMSLETSFSWVKVNEVNSLRFYKNILCHSCPVATKCCVLELNSLCYLILIWHTLLW